MTSIHNRIQWQFQTLLLLHLLLNLSLQNLILLHCRLMQLFQLFIFGQKFAIFAFQSIVVIFLWYQIICGIYLFLQTVVINLQWLDQSFRCKKLLSKLLDMKLEKRFHFRLRFFELGFERLQLRLKMNLAQSLDVFGIRCKLDVLQEEYLFVEELFLLITFLTLDIALS